jgi:hypothetical protein
MHLPIEMQSMPSRELETPRGALGKDSIDHVAPFQRSANDSDPPPGLRKLPTAMQDLVETQETERRKLAVA